MVSGAERGKRVVFGVKMRFVRVLGLKSGIRVSSFRRETGLQANKCSCGNGKKWQLSLEKTLSYAIIGLVADGGKKFQTKRDGRR